MRLIGILLALFVRGVPAGCSRKRAFGCGWVNCGAYGGFYPGCIANGCCNWSGPLSAPKPSPSPSPPPSPPSPPPPEPPPPPVGAIVGGVVGGLAFVALIVVVLVIMKKNQPAPLPSIAMPAVAAGTPVATNAVAVELPKAASGEKSLSQTLEELGCGQYEAALADQGYELLASLQGLTKEEAGVIADDVKMKPDHKRRFVDGFAVKRTETPGTPAATNAVSIEMPKAASGMNPVSIKLEKLGCGHYESALADQGYDRITFLQGLTKEQAGAIADDVKMKPGDKRRFVEGIAVKKTEIL